MEAAWPSEAYRITPLHGIITQNTTTQNFNITIYFHVLQKVSPLKLLAFATQAACPAHTNILSLATQTILVQDYK
jgi:hypothetical protein